MKLCPKCQKQFSDDANFCPVDAARLSPIDAKAAGGDSLSTRFELGDRLGGNHTGARFTFIEQGVHRAVGTNFGAAVCCGCEHGFDKQARIHGCFFG